MARALLMKPNMAAFGIFGSRALASMRGTTMSPTSYHLSNSCSLLLLRIAGSENCPIVGHRQSFCIRATSEFDNSASVESPLMQSMEKKENMREGMSRLIASGEHPFTLAEDRYFEEFIKSTRQGHSTATVPPPPGFEDSNTTSKGKGKEKRSLMDLIRFKQGGSSSSQSHVGQSGAIPTELVRYYMTDYVSFLSSEERQTLDILKWWKQNAITYPVLSKIARDVLSVPISSVASEQAFSTSGKILSEKRSRLREDILEALVCVKDWIDAEYRIQDQVTEDISQDFENLTGTDTDNTEDTH